MAAPEGEGTLSGSAGDRYMVRWVNGEWGRGATQCTSKKLHLQKHCEGGRLHKYLTFCSVGKIRDDHGGADDCGMEDVAV